MFRQLLCVCSLLGCLLAIGGCDDTDIGSLELTLKDDGSGELTIVRVRASSPSEQMSQIGGVEWNSSAALVVTTGQFSNLSSLNVGDLKFQTKSNGFLRVELPRGEDATWPKLLTVYDKDERQALKDSVKKTSIGTLSTESVKVVIKLPSNPISTGIAESEVLGVSPSMDKTSVTLIVPLELNRDGGHPIVWDIHW